MVFAVLVIVNNWT